MGFRLREIMLLLVTFLVLHVASAEKQASDKAFSEHKFDAVVVENSLKSRLLGQNLKVHGKDLSFKPESIEEVEENLNTEEANSVVAVQDVEQHRRELSSRCPSRFSGPYGNRCYYYHNRPVRWSRGQIQTYCRNIGGRNAFRSGRSFGCVQYITRPSSQDRRTVCGRGCGRRNLFLSGKEEESCPRKFHGPYSGVCYYFYFNPFGYRTHAEKSKFCQEIGGRNGVVSLSSGFACKYIPPSTYTWGRRALNFEEAEHLGEIDFESESETAVLELEEDRRMLRGTSGLAKCPRGFRGAYFGNRCIYHHPRPMPQWNLRQKGKFCRSIGGDNVIHPSRYWGRYFGCYKTLGRGRRALEIDENLENDAENFELKKTFSGEIEVENDRRQLSGGCARSSGWRYWRASCIKDMPRPSNYLSWSEKRRICNRMGANVVHPRIYNGRYWGCSKKFRPTPFPDGRPRYGRRALENIDEEIEAFQEVETLEKVDNDRRELSSRCCCGWRSRGNKCVFDMSRHTMSLSNRNKRKLCRMLGGENYVHPSSYTGRYWGCYKTNWPARDPNERRIYGRRALENIDEEIETFPEVETLEKVDNDRRELSSRRCCCGWRPSPYRSDRCHKDMSRQSNDLSWSNKGRICRYLGGDNYIHPRQYSGRYWGCYKTIWPARDPNERRIYGRRALENIDEEIETFPEVETFEKVDNDRRELSSRRCCCGWRPSPYRSDRCHKDMSRQSNDLSWSNKGRICRYLGGDNYIHPRQYSGRYWGCYKTIWPARDPNERRIYGRRALENIDEEIETSEKIGNDRRELSSLRCPRGWSGPSGSKCIKHMYAFRDISWANKGRLCRRIGGTNYIHPSSYTGRYWGCYKQLYAPRESNEFRRYGRRSLLEENDEDQPIFENSEDIREDFDMEDDPELMEAFLSELKEMMKTVEFREEEDDLELFEELQEENDLELFEEEFKISEDSEEIDMELFEELEIAAEDSEDIEMDTEMAEAVLEFEESLESFSQECVNGWIENDGECFMVSENPLRREEAEEFCQNDNDFAVVVDFMSPEEDEEADFICTYDRMEFEISEFENSEVITDEPLALTEDFDDIVDEPIPFDEEDEVSDCVVETPFNGVYHRSSETTDSGSPVFVEEVNGYQAFIEDGLWIFENPNADDFLESMISIKMSKFETHPETMGNWILPSVEMNHEIELESVPIEGCDLDSDNCLTFEVGGCGSEAENTIDMA